MVSIGSLGNSEVEASGSTTVTFHTWIAKRDLLPYEVRAISKHRGQCTVTQRPNPALLLVLVNKALFYLHMGHGGFQGSSWRSGAVVAETLWPGKSKRVALSLFQIKCASPGIGGQSLRPRNMSLGGRFTGRKTGFLLSLPGARAACPHCPDCAAGVSCSPNSEPWALFPETASYFGEHLALIGQTLLVTQLSIKMPRLFPGHVTHAEPTPAA